MFIDSQEVEDNLQACGKFPNQINEKELDVEEYDSEHEKPTTNLNFE
jgi:hypothetical protein